jgi:hypothetical protein
VNCCFDFQVILGTNISSNSISPGLIRFKGENFKESHEPIIEDTLQKAVQKRLSTSGTKLSETQRNNSLEPLETVKCGFCENKSLASYYSKKAGRKYSYCKCTTKTKISEKRCPS